MSTQENKPPVARFRSLAAPGLSVSVWEREGRYSVSIKKSYKGKDGNYRDANTYFSSDLLVLATLLNRALAFIDSSREIKEAFENAREGPTPDASPMTEDDDIPF